MGLGYIVDMRTDAGKRWLFRRIDLMLERGCQWARTQSCIDLCSGGITFATPWSETQIRTWASRYVAEKGGNLSQVITLMRCAYGQESTYTGNATTPYTVSPVLPRPESPTAPPAQQQPTGTTTDWKTWILPGAIILAVVVMTRR